MEPNLHDYCTHTHIYIYVVEQNLRPFPVNHGALMHCVTHTRWFPRFKIANSFIPHPPPSPKYTGIVVLRDNTSLTSWGKGWHCRSELRGTCRSRSAVPRSRVESLEARRWSTLAQPSSGRRGTCCDRSTRTLPKEQGVGKTRLREKQPKVYYSTVHILGI